MENFIFGAVIVITTRLTNAWIKFILYGKKRVFEVLSSTRKHIGSVGVSMRILSWKGKYLI